MEDKMLKNTDYAYFKFSYNVLYNKNLTFLEKILINLIYSLSRKEGYCFATNKKLANEMCCSEKSIATALKNLKSSNYITTSKSLDKFGVVTRKIIPNKDLLFKDAEEYFNEKKPVKKIMDYDWLNED